MARQSEGPDGALVPVRRYASGVLHGRQQGRPLRLAQKNAMDRLLPLLCLDVTRPIDVATLFADPVRELRLEIGFGGGEHLVTQAARHSHIGFIGCEPFRNGVATLLAQVDAQACRNVRVHAGDGGDVIDQLPAGCLDRVDLLYPDPWPKRRQRKRRFVSAASLTRLARVLTPGGTFRFATDIDDYAGWTLARILASPDFAWTPTGSDDWRTPWPDWVRTRYEAKAVREGRPPAYLIFHRR